jgi:hypothetical protein
MKPDRVNSSQRHVCSLLTEVSDCVAPSRSLVAGGGSARRWRDAACPEHGLGSVVGLQLVEDVRDVVLNCLQ